ncbi:MAG: DUF4276 family protein [Candidatus Paceibacterota bacterium]
MSATIFIEGGATGPDSKFLTVRCREGFHKLLAKCDLARQPALKACGGRGNTYKLYATAHKYAAAGDYVALLVDSEDPVADIEKPWEHLKQRDNWDKPANADDDQVLLMTTCMETWIAADREALSSHYGANLQVNALPALHDMESRDRHAVQDAIAHATRSCKNAYEKGKRSFEVLEQLRPSELRRHLPSFVRCEKILKDKLT